MVALRDLIGQEWAAVSACGAGVRQPCNLTETYLFICKARMGLVILFQAAHHICSRNQITHKKTLLHSSYTSPHLVLKTAASCDREGWLLVVVGTTVDSATSPKANVINLKHFATFIVSFFFFFFSVLAFELHLFGHSSTQ